MEQHLKPVQHVLHIHMVSYYNLRVPETVQTTETFSTSITICSYLEVARTRMRESGKKYRSFWQTLVLVNREEGRQGLYRGLGTQLLRQIPNTAIMMATYELTVIVLTNYVRLVLVNIQFIIQKMYYVSLWFSIYMIFLGVLI